MFLMKGVCYGFFGMCFILPAGWLGGMHQQLLLPCEGSKVFLMSSFRCRLQPLMGYRCLLGFYERAIAVYRCKP